MCRRLRLGCHPAPIRLITVSPSSDPAHSFSGRCLCGAVRYRFAAPILSSALCHCESCRRASGAHVVGWITLPRQTLVMEGPVQSFASSARVMRQFCGRCGTQLTYAHESQPLTIDITLATLDQAEATPPTVHVWMSDAFGWDRPNDELPRYRTTRSGGTS
jgi:hypothetical protein